MANINTGLPDPNIPKGQQKAFDFNMRDGAHEEYPWVHTAHQAYAPISDGHDEGSVQLTPTSLDPNFSGKHRHPFELESYVVSEENATEERPAGALVLRCYYGELHHTVSTISTEYLKVEDVDGAEKEIYPIEGQPKIKGIDIAVPADFATAIQDAKGDFFKVSLGYAEWVGTESRTDEEGDPIPEKKNDPDEEDQPYGSVYLKWSASEAGAGGAELVLVYEDEELDEEDPISELVKSSGKLSRERPNGDYYLLIGEHRNTSLIQNQGAAAIEQKIFDNVYWAPTIVIGADKDDAPPPTTTTPPPSIGINLSRPSSRMSFLVGTIPVGTTPGRVGGGVFDGPAAGGGIMQGAGGAGAGSGIVSTNPPHKPITDAPANKIGGASPIVRQLETFGVDPNKASLQKKLRMQRSKLNYSADPFYGLD